jgi:hypothetical protein
MDSPFPASSRLRIALSGMVAALAIALGGCGGGDDDGAAAETSPSPPRPESGTLVYAVGDAADGEEPATDLAEFIVRQRPDRFLYLGDVYEHGTRSEFRRHYEPMYGALAERTDPTIGNHEYLMRERGYYPYWGGKRGWSREEAKHHAYVDEPSGWQIIAYSSQTPDIAAEAEWVRAQIDKHPGTCRIVMAHKGRHVVTDSEHTDNPEQEPVWRALVGTTAINLVGHNHVYGRLEPIRGVHVIVSGAGGHDLRDLGEQHHRIAASTTQVPSATRLVLRRGEADLKQIDATGTVHDRTTIACVPADGTAP